MAGQRSESAAALVAADGGAVVVELAVAAVAVGLADSGAVVDEGRAAAPAFGALTGATRSAQQGGHMATMAAAALIARRRGRGNGEDTDDEDDYGDSTEKGHRT